MIIVFQFLLSLIPVSILPEFPVSPEKSKFAVIKRYNPLYLLFPHQFWLQIRSLLGKVKGLLLRYVQY